MNLGQIYSLVSLWVQYVQGLKFDPYSKRQADTAF